MVAADFEVRLDKIEDKLGQIAEILAKMSVQTEQISSLQRQSDALWRKHEKISDDLVLIKNFQAACPRQTVGWMWAVIIPIAVTLIGMLYHVVRASGGAG